MTKYQDAEDVGYERVSGELWIWVRDLNRRRETTQTEPSRVTQIPPTELAAERDPRLLENTATDNTRRIQFSGAMSNVGQVWQANNIGTINFGQNRSSRFAS